MYVWTHDMTKWHTSMHEHVDKGVRGARVSYQKRTCYIYGDEHPFMYMGR